MKVNRFGTIWSVKLTLLFIALGGVVFLRLPSVAGRTGLQNPTPEQTEFFEKKIRPILTANCQQCHNVNKKTAGLDLSTAEGFMHGGRSGTALVNKAEPEASFLLKVISYEGELKMPPTGRMKDEDIATLTAWVKLGAPYLGR